MNNVLGYIFGQDSNELQFVLSEDNEAEVPTRIEIGELLIIIDRVTEEKFLARVTNIKYGQEKRWTQEVAHQANSPINILSDHQFKQMETDSGSKQLFLIPICELIGYIDKDECFLTPKHLPSYFSLVKKPEENDLKLLGEHLGDIYLGQLRSGSTVLPIQAGIFGHLLPKHIGIFAQTGGGKSNTMLRLMGEVLSKKGLYSLLVFDPHGEYAPLIKAHPYATSEYFQCYSITGLQGNTLRIPYEAITIDSVLNLKSLNWTEAQERVMREAQAHFNKEWFEKVTCLPFDIIEQEVTSSPETPLLDELLIDGKDPKVIALKTARSKLQRLKQAPFLTPNPAAGDLHSIVAALENGKTVLIDMASLSGLFELFLSSIISSKILNKRKRDYIASPEEFKKSGPISIVMEEAQRVLGRGDNNEGNIFAQICNEGRKFGVGLIAITQQPKLINDILISQFNTLIILSISDDRDFNILSGVSKKPLGKLKKEIQSLMPGEAIISSPSSPFALPLKIELYDTHRRNIKRPKKSGGYTGSFKNFFS